VGKSNINTQVFSSVWLSTESMTWEIQTYTEVFFHLVAYRRRDVGKSNTNTQAFSSVWLPTEDMTWEIQTYVHRSFLPCGCLQKA
jgi:hypothetical protein